jgi:hypothetical protein
MGFGFLYIVIRKETVLFLSFNNFFDKTKAFKGSGINMNEKLKNMLLNFVYPTTYFTL